MVGLTQQTENNTAAIVPVSLFCLASFTLRPTIEPLCPRNPLLLSCFARFLFSLIFVISILRLRPIFRLLRHAHSPIYNATNSFNYQTLRLLSRCFRPVYKSILSFVWNRTTSKRLLLVSHDAGQINRIRRVFFVLSSRRQINFHREDIKFFPFSRARLLPLIALLR